MVYGNMDRLIDAAVKQAETDKNMGSQATRDRVVKNIRDLTGPGADASPLKWQTLKDVLKQV
jgi:hypothetical protein